MRHWITSGLALAVTGSVSWSCCMVPESYEGSISQRSQEAVIIHDDGKQDMVLRIDYRIKGKTMPDKFAWVITVPNEPSDYAIADAKLFDDMFNLSEILRPKPKHNPDEDSLSLPAPTDAVAQSVEKSVELGKRVQVGPFDIQPVRGVGPKALTGLNQWLTKNGFPNEDEQ